ncbi:MAG: hypothetical protein H0U27_06080 [Nitrosopumilus sp.]|nr:hypothetical protein [Nitrosopumilus sp.]
MSIPRLFESVFFSNFSAFFETKESDFKVIDDMHTTIFSFLSLKDQTKMALVSKSWQVSAVSAVTCLQIEKIKKFILSIQNNLKLTDGSFKETGNLAVYNSLTEIAQSIFRGEINRKSFLDYKESFNPLITRMLDVLRYVDLRDMKSFECPILFEKIIPLSIAYNYYERGKEQFHSYDQSIYFHNAILELVKLDDFEEALKIALEFKHTTDKDLNLNFLLDATLQRKLFSLAELIAANMFIYNDYQPYLKIAKAALLEKKYQVVARAAKKIDLKKLQDFKGVVISLAENEQYDLADEVALRLVDSNSKTYFVDSRRYYELVSEVAKL